VDKNFLPRFIRGVFSTGAGAISQIILGFLGFMIIVRFIPKEELGIYILIEVTYTFFGLVSNLALENLSATKFITSVKDEEKTDVASAAICYKIAIGLILGAVILLCRPLISIIYRNELLSRFLIYVPLLFILSSLNEFFFRIQQGFHQYKKMAAANIIQGTVSLLLIIILLVFLRMHIQGLILAYVLAFTASISYQYLMIPIKRKFNLNPRLYVKLFRFGFPLGLNNILYFAYTRIDRLMLGAMISPMGVANYEVASRIPNKAQQLFGSFNNVFFPNLSECFARNSVKEGEKIIDNSLRLISFATIFAALVAAIFRKEIVRLLFSERYIESAPALAIIMVSLSIAITGIILGTSLVALGQSDKPVKVNIINVTINIICNLVLIPAFGFVGAAYAALISHSVTIPIYVWFLKKARVRIEITHYLKALLAYCFLLTVFLLVKPISLITKLAFIITFILISFFLAVIKKKDVVYLLSGLRPSPQMTK
jgi:O-antigen/teichoic acid export membrane protein